MPKAAPLIRIGFPDGEQPVMEPALVPPTALAKALNVRADTAGVLRIRRGTRQVAGSGAAGGVQAMVPAFGGVVAAWGGGLYRYDAAWTRTVLAEGVLGTGRVTLADWSYGGAERVYVFSGNGLRDTDGASVSLVQPYAPGSGEPVNLLRANDGSQDVQSGPARCTLALVRAGISQRLVATGDPQSPNTVYLSGPDDPTYWPANQVIQLPDDGHWISAVATYYGALLIFRDGPTQETWAFFGADATDASARLEMQSDTVGCIAPRSIAFVPGIGLVFLGGDNLYALRVIYTLEFRIAPEPVGTAVLPLLRAAIQAGAKDAVAVFQDFEYRLYVPAVDSEARVFRLSLLGNQAWYADSGPLLSDLAVIGGRLYGASAEADAILDLAAPVPLDGDRLIPVHVEFRREALEPGPARVKRAFLYVLAAGTVTQQQVSWWADLFGASSVGSGSTEAVAVLAGTEQHFTLTLLADGIQQSAASASVYVQQMETSRIGYQPVLIFELRFRPSVKASFAQLVLDAMVPGDDIAILGYALEYSVRGRLHGIRSGVSVG